MHELHARLPKNFVLEERLERYSDAIEANPYQWKGMWAEACYPNIGADTGAGGTTRYRAVRLDLGCGKAAFSIEEAKHEPDVLFIAMDYEPVYVAYAAQNVMESECKNVVVVAGNGMRLREMFADGEIERIYLNYPTPFPRKRDADKRLVSLERLMDYREILVEGGEVRMRTDSQPLRDFTLTQLPLAGYELLWSSDDARQEQPDEPLSEYEERLSAQGAHVLALTFRPAPGPAPEHPVQTAELSLACYLPSDLSQIEYLPHGMEATVENLRNREAKHGSIEGAITW